MVFDLLTAYPLSAARAAVPFPKNPAVSDGSAVAAVAVSGKPAAVSGKPAAVPDEKELSVSGIVTDSRGESLPGALVKLRETAAAAATDSEGRFSLTISSWGKHKLLTLEVSFLGMKTAHRAIDPAADNRSLKIALEDDALLMDEVLVTGYQSVKRESATGSYQLVSAEKLNQTYHKELLEGLEGKVPGLVSYNNGLSGGGEAGLTIRGVGSFQAKTNPLVVVDGLPIEGGLASVNPDNIESITVLKDAAAASIYGARASNGVIVITSRQARTDHLSLEFSANYGISEKNDYSVMDWADASELIQLERNNFNWIVANSSTAYKDLKNSYKSKPKSLSPILRLLMAADQGDLSQSELDIRLTALAANDYRSEWQQLMERPRATQQYNLALRNRSDKLNSSLVLNYLGDNRGLVNEYADNFTLNWRGLMDLSRWLSLEFGANLIATRGREHASSLWNGINSFAPYTSMYNADGSLADMEAEVYLSEPSLQDAGLGLKSEAYNLNDEIGRNFTDSRENNIRTYAHAYLHLLPGWTLSGMFQFEDIYSKADSYLEADSYDMRHLYNLYTSTDGTHYLPDAGMLRTAGAEGAYYTFRAQSDYAKTFADRHEVNLLGGFEYRQTKYNSLNQVLLGYDDLSQTNNMGTANFGTLTQLSGTVSALGNSYSMVEAPSGSDFRSSVVLHRYYSVYLNGNYVLDHRYALSASWRVDHTDLFGADPEFRRRPLWSVGASWNLGNEPFMESLWWLEALKLRASYGLTGNIDQSVSSYLTASVDVNELNGNRYAYLNTPPNEQLRWEKTASVDVGLDFAVRGGRLSGAVDVYVKNGSDLLTVTDIDPTTGWTSLTINNGKARNAGFELQLSSDIIPAPHRDDFGLSSTAAFSYNNNRVTAVNHQPTSGTEALSSYNMTVGYPVHSLYSYRFAGFKTIQGIQYFGWYDHDDNVNFCDIESERFTPEDVVYSGSLDPTTVVSLTPEFRWKGFALSALFCYYGGHVMRARTEDWSSDGSQYGYNSLAELEAVPSAYLRFWNEESGTRPANGFRGSVNVVGDYRHMDTNVVPADFIKMRNVALDYRLKEAWCSRIGLSTARVRLQAENFCLWHRNKLGLDPEACNPHDGTVGVSAPRCYTVSLNLTY